jgi:hypothetical protein
MRARDDDEDAPDRPGRRRAVVVALLVAGLCGAALFTGLGGLGVRPARPVAPTAAPAPPAAPAGGTRSRAGNSPAAPAPAAPAPAAPAPAARTPVSPGSLVRDPAGVLVGYRRDAAGAVAAAGNYTAALYVQANRTRARESAVLAAIATSAVDAARMTGDFASEDAALAGQLGVPDLQGPTVIAYGHPLGYRVETATADTATVDVYVGGGQGLAGVSSGAPTAGRAFFEVDQLQLQWRPAGPGGDWRLRDFSHLVQDNGPDPGTVAAAGYLPFPIGQSPPTGAEGSS